MLRQIQFSALIFVTVRVYHCDIRLLLGAGSRKREFVPKMAQGGIMPSGVVEETFGTFAQTMVKKESFIKKQIKYIEDNKYNWWGSGKEFDHFINAINSLIQLEEQARRKLHFTHRISKLVEAFPIFDDIHKCLFGVLGHHFEDKKNLCFLYRDSTEWQEFVHPPKFVAQSNQYHYSNTGTFNGGARIFRGARRYHGAFSHRGLITPPTSDDDDDY